jgi:uracil-DNA glycosylase
MSTEVNIDPSWKQELSAEFSKPYWRELSERIRHDYQTTKIYPPPTNVFRAYNQCPFNKVKVVILGQDPYHGQGQANGLSFAVNDGITLPPSLKNIFKEIQSDTGVTPLPSGDLSRWADQGVLMLNSVLTVQAGNPASHAGLGWEKFTDATIQALNSHRQHIVYMLWGKYAKEKGSVINREQNLVLESAHPSPYSATQFFGHHHFSLCNQYLIKHSQTPINWQ